MWDPIAYALGFLDCKDISARCMLSIFHFFATKTDASRLRMLNGSPRDRLLQPILDYITSRGGSLELRTGAVLLTAFTKHSTTFPIVLLLVIDSSGQGILDLDCERVNITEELLWSVQDAGR